MSETIEDGSLRLRLREARATAARRKGVERLPSIVLPSFEDLSYQGRQTPPEHGDRP